MGGSARPLRVVLSMAIALFSCQTEVFGATKRPSAISPSLQTTTEDERKAQDLIFSDGLYRVIQQRDSTLAFALVQMQRAKSPDDVTRIFRESITNGRADPEFDRDVMVPLIKKGVEF